ncbi:MAG: folylpolyglutamate synthase/dihydrofolate synthase family protein [Pirellulales bacterium]
MPETCLSPPAYQQALDFLFSRIDYERMAAPSYGRREFRLDRMRDLLARVDNPHRAFPIVHIAGTKGKGSTAAMVAGMLTAAGYRTGLYSSPHLERIEERVAIDGRPCSPAELIELVEWVRPAVETMDRRADRGEGGGRPTYFEITTAMALAQFARRRVEAAVIEVGMGGRLDSTNICQPVVSVITTISFDHTRQLGNTLAAIAREKAGIIKPGVPVISGVLDSEPRKVIAATAAERGARLIQLGEHFDLSYQPPRDLQFADEHGRMNFIPKTRELAPEYRDLELGLVGSHQATNAAVAIATVAQLRGNGWMIPESAVREGLAEIRWPARVEVVTRRPAVVVDAAHNVASIASLLTTLDESFIARRRWLVFATTQDKPVREMLAQLLPRFDGVVVTRYFNNPRYVPVEELAAVAREVAASLNAQPGVDKGRPGTTDTVRLHCCDTPGEAWQRVKELASPEDLICVTGSFFLAAEMRQAIRNFGVR